MREIGIDEAKKELVSVLDEFHGFCEKHSLKYVLAAGTLLGAVRHNGFIPWDDDIDIYMPRPDYDRLLKLYPSEGENDLYEHSLNDMYKYPFAKIGKRGTLCVEKGGYSGIDIGIYIDIFPIDGLGNDYAEAKRTVRKVKKYVNMELSLLVEQWRKDVSFVKNFAIWILHCFTKLYGGHKKVLQKMKQVLSKRSYSDCKYVGQIVEMPQISKITERTIYDDRQLHIFENGSYYIPSDYDFILRNLYGDYMKLPPEEKRVYAHGYKAYILDEENKNEKV